MKYYLIFFSLLLSPNVLTGQKSLEEDMQVENDFLESDQLKGQVRYALIFFQDIVTNDKSTFLSKRGKSKAWLEKNSNIVNDYENIRHHMTQFVPKDTTLSLSYDYLEDGIIRITNFSVIYGSKDELCKDSYICKFLFYNNKENDELLGVETEFRKHEHDPNMPSFD